MEKHRWDVMNPLRNDAMAYIQGYVNRAKEPTSPEYIDRMQEGEVPEEIGNWIEKEASRIANEPIIHEFQAARAGLIRMYKYLQPTYKQAIELLSDRCRELESQLSAYPPPTNTEQK
jgi:hypothetical protein